MMRNSEGLEFYKGLRVTYSKIIDD